MKNKKIAQIEAKKKHNAELAAVKARRRKEPELKRVGPSRISKPVILILCEGENTEPSYFRQFKLTSATIKAFGEGYNTISLVKQAIAVKQKGHYDQIWCVFDKDIFKPVDFNRAISMATTNNLGVAYSNQAFEYWLILHLEDHQGGGMDRAEYEPTINEYIEPLGAHFDGKGSKIITAEFFDILNGIDEQYNKSRIELAIKRAKRTCKLYSNRTPAKAESSTTVFKLVEEILKYI